MGKFNGCTWLNPESRNIVQVILYDKMNSIKYEVKLLKKSSLHIYT